MGLAPRRAYVDCCLHAHLPRHMAMGMTYLLFAYPQSTSRLFCTWVSIHTSFSIAVYPLLYMVYLSIFQTLHLSVFSFMFHLKKSTFKSVTIWFQYLIMISYQFESFEPCSYLDSFSTLVAEWSYWYEFVLSCYLLSNLSHLMIYHHHSSLSWEP